MTQSDEQILRQRYTDMYDAMIAKDTLALREMMSEGFSLIHMTGMHQSKSEYLKAIANGTLNYFSCKDSDIKIRIEENKALLTGKSRVEAAVFGSGRYTWPLRLDIDWKKEDGKWIIEVIRAGTY